MRKTKQMKKIIYILFLLFAISTGKAQQNDSLLLIHYYSESEGLRLKWLPVSNDVFIDGFEHGYNLYRSEVKKTLGGGEKLGEFVKLNSEPIKAWSQEKLNEKAAQDSMYWIAELFIENADEFLNQGSASVKEAFEKAESRDMLMLLGNFSVILSNKVADAMGMYWVDKDIDLLTKYVYKLEVLNEQKSHFELLVHPQLITQRSKVMGLTSSLEPGVIRLSWFNNSMDFPYFNIYRSESKNGKFRKLNPIPYTGGIQEHANSKAQTSFIDSIPEYGKTYYYKVIGVNAFEVEGLPSDILPVKANYLMQGRPEIYDSKTIDENDIELQWSLYPDDEPYVKGFTVWRSSRGSGDYLKVNEGILASNSRSFIDRTEKISSNYYKVCAYGDAGDSICSILYSHLLVDSIPPTAPEMIEGECDTLGHVRFSWHPAPEDDVMGYRVFRMYQKGGELIRLTSGHITDTMYNDTISVNMQLGKVYYSVSAIDGNTNPSLLAEPLEVEVPDLKPPRNGSLTNYQVSLKGIEIQWQNSTAPDLKAMHIYRKSRVDLDYKRILSVPVDSGYIKSYLDTLTKSKMTYSYVIRAEDKTGLFSDFSKPLTVEQMSKDKIPSVKNLEVFVSPETETIKLVWQFDGNAQGFRIFRAEDNKKPVTHAFTNGTKREYEDKRLKPNTEYTYMLYAELKGGFKSGYSKKVTVKY